MTVGGILCDFDTGAGIAGVDDTVSAHVDGNMSAVADDITGSGVFNSAGDSSAYRAKSMGGMRKTSSEMSVDRHDKTGTIRTVCKAGTTIDIGVAEETSRVSHHGLSP